MKIYNNNDFKNKYSYKNNMINHNLNEKKN